MNREQKIKLLDELGNGNIKPLQALKNNMPKFITYYTKDGIYCLDWENKRLTEDEFDELKRNCPFTEFWHEQKRYEE